VNEKKAEIQNQAYSAWKSTGYKGRLEMCTGSGKSRVAVLAAMEVQEEICLIVPTENLRDNNWKSEFKRWGNLEVYEKITRICYASASKIKNKKFNLIILDEVHRLTPLASIFFENNKVKKIISLTATMADNEERKELINIITPKVFSYTLEQGVIDKVVAPFNLHIIETTLDKKVKNISAGNIKNPFLATEDNQYRYLDRLYKTNLFDGQMNAAGAWANKRMHFLYSLPSKTALAIKIKDHIFKNKRGLIFCGSKKQAEEVHKYFYHSGNSKSDNLTKLIKKEIDILACVNKLNEGANIPDLDIALIVQLKSKELDLIQRIGRIVRWRENHIADIYIIKILGTQDEVWVNKALNAFDPEITKITYHHAETFLRTFD